MPLIRFDFQNAQVSHVLIWLEPASFLFLDYAAGLDYCAYQGPLTNAAYSPLDTINRVEFIKRAFWMMGYGRELGSKKMGHPSLFLEALCEESSITHGQFYECSGNFFWHDLVGWNSQEDLRNSLPVSDFEYMVRELGEEVFDLDESSDSSLWISDLGKLVEKFEEKESEPFFFLLTPSATVRARTLADTIFEKLSPFLD